MKINEFLEWKNKQSYPNHKNNMNNNIHDKIEPDKPLSFEQAVNYLEEKKDTLAKDTKKAMSDIPISTASPQDRKRYLHYGISLLSKIPGSIKNTIPDTFKNGVSDRELVNNIKRYMTLRIEGYSIIHIARFLDQPIQSLLLVEKATMSAMKEAIETRKASGIPILGSN